MATSKRPPARNKRTRKAVSHTIESVDIDTPKPYGTNPRQHSDEQIENIARSIKAFGFLKPIIVDEDGVILAGHGALLAARRLALKKVPIIRMVHLTPAEKRAYRIADNKLALSSTWDVESLAEEIEALRSLDMDLNLTGFDETELARLEDDLAELRLGTAAGASGEPGDGTEGAPAGPGGVQALSLVFSTKASRDRVYESLNEAVKYYGVTTMAEALDRVCKHWSET